jgi:hypothetical protein
MRLALSRTSTWYSALETAATRDPCADQDSSGASSGGRRIMIPQFLNCAIFGCGCSMLASTSTESPRSRWRSVF